MVRAVSAALGVLAAACVAGRAPTPGAPRIASAPASAASAPASAAPAPASAASASAAPASAAPASAAPGPTAPTQAPTARAQARSDASAAPGAATPARAPAAHGAPGPVACDDTVADALARVSCDGSRVLTAHPIELHPDRPVPDEPTRSVLAAVAETLNARPEILLVRIEVFTSELPTEDRAKRRAALAAAQRRADALLRYLWRKHGISAERLEAVAHERRGVPVAGERYPVIFRIVQRARR